MLEDLIAFHHEVMRFIPNEPQRYLYGKMNLNTQSLYIMGNRGVKSILKTPIYYTQSIVPSTPLYPITYPGIWWDICAKRSSLISCQMNIM